MSLPVTLAVTLDLIAVGLVLWWLRGRWLGNTGALLLIVLVFYHGLTELVQAAFPNRNTYRLMTNQAALETTALMASAAILLFAVSYIVARGRDHGPPADSALRVLWDARHPIFAFAALATVMRITGRVSADLAGLDTATGYWQTGLVVEFGDMFLMLAALAAVYRWTGERALTYTILVLAVLMAIAGGSRLLMLIAVLTVVGTAARYGYRMRVSRLAILGAFGLLLMIAISAARLAVGREQLKEGGTSARVEGLVGGIRELGRDDNLGAKEGVLDDFVYRFDGNAFSAMVHEEFRSGREPMGWFPLGADVLLMIPSFVYRSKLDIDPLLLNEKFLAVLYFGFPLGDYNVMGLGHFYAMFGVGGLMLVAVLGGLLFGRLDAWLPAQESLLAVLVGVGLFRCVTYYEWGPSIYLATMRTGLALFALLGTWLWLRRRAAARGEVMAVAVAGAGAAPEAGDTDA